MPNVATLPANVPKVDLEKIPDSPTMDTDKKFDDQSTPAGREGSYFAGDKTLAGEEDLLLTSDKTPTVELESFE